jgi:hypothetical protein
MSASLSYLLRRVVMAAALAFAAVSCDAPPHSELAAESVAREPQAHVDIVAYFRQAQGTRGAGLARKTQLVDARPATPGEIIVTVIRGEGVETRSPPAGLGDMVVRNRCPETGNEEILVPRESFSQRYDRPSGAAGADGWLPYRPRGVQMRFVIVADVDGEFAFVAPWGETMVARPGDSIVQDLNDPSDSYRIARAAFACTYEVLQNPQR